MYLPIAEGALNPFLSWRGGDLFFRTDRTKKTGDPSTRMRAVLPLPRPILLFHGEKAFEGRFNALLIICKDARLLILLLYIGDPKARLCNARRKSDLSGFVIKRNLAFLKSVSREDSSETFSKNFVPLILKFRRCSYYSIIYTILLINYDIVLL